MCLFASFLMFLFHWFCSDFVFVFSCLSFVISTCDGFLGNSGFVYFCLLFLYFAKIYIFPFFNFSFWSHVAISVFLRISRSG